MGSMDIHVAAAIAGDGGVIRRNGDSYNVNEVLTEGNPSEWRLNNLPLKFFYQDSWEVVREAPKPTLKSAGDYFADLKMGHVVVSTKGLYGLRYVYMGRTARDGVSKVALVALSEGHSVNWLGPDELNAENQWTTVDLISDITVYESLVALDKELVARSRAMESAVTELDDVRSDFEKLNQLLNEYADDDSLCSEYEDTLDEWNESFAVMKLVGRKQDWEVAVTINGGMTAFYGPVSARTAKEAAEMVDRLSEMEIIENLYGRDEISVRAEEEGTRRM